MIRRAVPILSAMILLGSFIGCNRIQKGTDQASAMDEFSNSWSKVFYADISDMSQIITSLLDNLGCTLEDTKEEGKRYTWNCRAPGGICIEIQAQPYFKGKSYLRLCTRGEEDDVVKRMRSDIDRALEDAKRRYYKQ